MNYNDQLVELCARIRAGQDLEELKSRSRVTYNSA